MKYSRRIKIKEFKTSVVLELSGYLFESYVAVWQRGHFDGQSATAQNVTQPGIHARPSNGRTLRLFHPKLNKSKLVLFASTILHSIRL